MLDPDPEDKPRVYWVGIDGEGITLGEPRRFNEGTVITGTEHRYISMSYRSDTGQGDQLEAREGLRTRDCLTFILSIPKACKIAAYGFGYDLSKILEDIPPELIYLLTHPDRRAYKVQGGRTNYRPVIWEGFALDLFNSRFKVGYAELRQPVSGMGRASWYGKDWRVVNDLAKFYQAPFVTACKNWGVGTAKERDIMRQMKSDRRNLIKYTQEEILDYSNKECQWLAELAQKLDDACEGAGAPLKGQYFGAGSIAKSLMRNWDIKSQIVKHPPEIERLARFAFFGGRFELSRRGRIEKSVHDWDISSAYPYQIYHLPCLKCGNWSKTTDVERVKQAQAALCNYELEAWKGALPPWGPFPFRDRDGSIPFPIESKGGWIHKDEFLIGMKLFPNVKFKGAWVYETSCGHHPFKNIATIYLERLRIGKEGPGIILKLGANAVAGSIMQTIGTRPYHDPIWAGMITSGTRAQLLEMLGQHEKWSDVLMMATDGLWGFAEVTPPKPKDTGTDFDVIEEKTGKKTRKPLGAWEHAVFEKGVFMARPGIYFPLDLADVAPEDESEDAAGKMKDLKARGIGIKTLYLHRARIMRHYDRWGGAKPYIIGDKDPLKVIRERLVPAGVERFVGYKSGILRTAKLNEQGGVDGEIIKKRDVYGLWTLQNRKIDFKALPKRLEPEWGPLFEKDRSIGVPLRVRRMGKDEVSAEYDKMKSKFTLEDLLAGVTDLGFHDDEQDDWGEGS